MSAAVVEIVGTVVGAAAGAEKLEIVSTPGSPMLSTVSIRKPMRSPGRTATLTVPDWPLAAREGKHTAIQNVSGEVAVRGIERGVYIIEAKQPGSPREDRQFGETDHGSR